MSAAMMPMSLVAHLLLNDVKFFEVGELVSNPVTGLGSRTVSMDSEFVAVIPADTHEIDWSAVERVVMEKLS